MSEPVYSVHNCGAFVGNVFHSEVEALAFMKRLNETYPLAQRTVVKLYDESALKEAEQRGALRGYADGDGYAC